MLLGSFLLPAPAPAQAEPRIAGEIEIRLREGALRGDVCLSVPQASDTIAIALNRALTLRTVNGGPPNIVDATPEPGGATVIYTLAPSTPSRSETNCLTYDGWEETYDIDRRVFRDDDASSLIALDGETIRARGAARWLPTPFDSRIGLPAERMAFDLQVRCFDCGTIYMNGGEATRGPAATFRSEVPREPYLVAGTLRARQTNGSWIISPREVGPAADSLLAAMEAVQGLYSDYVGVPFDRQLDLLFLTEVREPRRGRLWGFFSDPALTIIGMSPAELTESLRDERARVRRSVLRFLAHELAHRYFGWGFGLESAQRDLFGEPFATFLELTALRQAEGEDAYVRAVAALADQLSGLGDLPPADRADPEAFSYGAYRYGYLPLLLLTLEAAIGEPAMQELLRDLLELDPATRSRADFGLLVERAERIGGSAEVAEWLRCLDPEVLRAICSPALLP